MELKQLRYFVMLANELHFQRAARMLCVTQPALSQQIKNLECKLEQLLFERDRQSVKLTPAGALLLEEVSPLITQIDNAVDKVRLLDKKAPASLKVSLLSYVGLRPINLALLKFRQHYPDTDFQTIQAPGNEVQDLVREGKIDAGFTPNPVTHPALVVKKIVEGNWVLVVPDDHPLSEKESIPIQALDQLLIVFFAREFNAPLYDWVIDQIEAAGGSINIIFEAIQVSAALDLVRDGLGCYLVMDYLLSSPESLNIVPLTGFPHPTRVKFVWHEDNRNPALHALVKILRESIEENE